MPRSFHLTLPSTTLKADFRSFEFHLVELGGNNLAYLSFTKEIRLDYEVSFDGYYVAIK